MSLLLQIAPPLGSLSLLRVSPLKRLPSNPSRATLRGLLDKKTPKKAMSEIETLRYVRLNASI